MIAHKNLGIALQKKQREKRQLDETIPAYRQAIVLASDASAICNNPGTTLQDKEPLDAVIAAQRTPQQEQFLKLMSWNVNLHELCQRHRLNPKGIIHVGAHYAEEREHYRRTGAKSFLWIEADPANMMQLKANIAGYGNSRALNACLSDVDDQPVHFYRSSNTGRSSSILAMQTHQKHYPRVQVVENMTVRTRSFAKLVESEGIIVDDYDFLVLDVQGAELMALRGFQGLLQQFRGIYLVVNIEHHYINGALLPEIDSYLKLYGFARRETLINDENWGDALYLRDDAFPAPVAYPPSRVAELDRRLMAQRFFTLHFSGQEKRSVEILDTGRFGAGATHLEQADILRAAGHEIILETIGTLGRSCCLNHIDDLVWRGESSIFPNIAVELIPRVG